MKTLGGAISLDEQLLETLPGYDLYWSPNTFYPVTTKAKAATKGLSWIRSTGKHLCRLNTVFADLDIYKVTDENPEDVLPRVIKTLTEQLAPLPHLAVFSGRGIHLYWLIEPEDSQTNTKAFWQSVGTWKSCSSKLIHILKPFGIDAVASHRPSGLLRVPGTVNTKGRALKQAYAVDIATHQPRLNLQQLDKSLPPIPPGQAQRSIEGIHYKKGVCPHPEHTKSIHELMLCRQADLRDLLEDRLARGYRWEGKRNNFLFIWSQIHGRKFTHDDLLALNNRMHEGVPDNESNVKSITINRGYKIRNRKIISELQISDDEMIRLRLRTLVSPRVSYLRRRENAVPKQDGRTLRAARTRARIVEISELNLSHEEIAIRCGVSVATVYRVLPKGRKRKAEVVAGGCVPCASQKIDRSNVLRPPLVPPPCLLPLECLQIQHAEVSNQAVFEAEVEDLDSGSSLTHVELIVDGSRLKVNRENHGSVVALEVTLFEPCHDLKRLQQILLDETIVFISKDSMEVLRFIRQLGMPPPRQLYDLDLADSLLGGKYRHQQNDCIEKPTSKKKFPQTLSSAWQKIKEELVSKGLWNIYETFELPARDVLAEMEAEGLPFDQQEAGYLHETFTSQLEILRRRSQAIVGRSFDLDNSHQVEVILFDELQLPEVGRNKNGRRSLDSTVLRNIGQLHELPNLIAKYRKIKHLLNQNIEAVLSAVDNDGRVRGKFSNSRTETGRASCREPNLQGLQSASVNQENFRSCFKAGPGKVLVKADYSQMEVRVLATLCQCMKMLDIFSKQGDIYRFMASEIFAVSIKDVKPHQRKVAKELTLAILYGMKEFGLAQKLGIAKDRALELLQYFHSSFPEIAIFQTKLVAKVRRTGFIQIPGGKRRWFAPDAFKTPKSRSRTEREILNTMVQGTAAVMLKDAMIILNEVGKSEVIEPRLILQVHDELLFEVDASIAKDWAFKVQFEMEKAGDRRGMMTPVAIQVAQTWS